MSRYTPHRSQQLSHCSYDRYLARFSCSAKTFVVLSKPRIAADQLRNAIQSDFRKRAFPSGIAGPFAKRFLPD